MFKIPLVTSGSITKEQFWKAVFLYHNIPHVINRRILTLAQLFFLKINFKHELYTIKDILKYSEIYSQIYKLESVESKHINTSIITNIFDQFKDFSYETVDFNEVKNSEHDIFVSVRILFPRNSKFSNCVECVIIDKENSVASFLAVSKNREFSMCPNFPYDIELDNSSLLKICVLDTETAEQKECDWLVDSLFTKLINWTQDETSNKSVLKSLSLINQEDYCKLYQTLKDKYGSKIVKVLDTDRVMLELVKIRHKMWPETTDPLKYVYEDIGIATYLLILWGGLKQKFVDLGCGNGLLVHILSEEGHEGCGIDIRARKIWNMYPETTKLKVDTIIPSSKFLFPDVDWIIGNHSDELSPWIPVLAAKSSPKCKFFLLPCCSYEFDGKKYQRSNTSISQYQDFVAYVQTISEVCGFNTLMDKLRISSTKRICLVGSDRQLNNIEQMNKNINKFIRERIGQEINEENEWLENYETRPSVEKVRNCTKLNKSLIDRIVKTIFQQLLSSENYITVSSGKNWNAGNTICLPDLVKIIPSDDLKQLKRECGGLQTLLRNHHYIFLVNKGKVQLRFPKTDKKFVTKSKDCWFYFNHPHGCPLNSEECNYLHPEVFI